MVSFRCRQRAEAPSVDRVIRATFLHNKNSKSASPDNLSHALSNGVTFGSKRVVVDE